MATEANSIAAEVAETAAKLSTGLHISGLDGGVTEEQLKQLFSQTGEVTSVKVCVDKTSEGSPAYGYVNYANPQHAAKALENLNLIPLNGKPMSISYSDRDPSLNQSCLGKVFVKNLDSAIDDKALHEIFAAFGDIISCRVEIDSLAVSKGYGFVHYDNGESANSAIDHLNGHLLHGKNLYVEPYKDMSVTNVYVKNFDESISEEDLKLIFGDFGLITSAVVMRDEDGKSKCFGFVNFQKGESATKSIQVLNGQMFNDKRLYVARFQKKSEREKELKIYHEKLSKDSKDEARKRLLGINNLFIRNINKDIDNKKLRELFSPFGTIQSSKIMYDTKGISKGYGFIELSTAEETSRAISEMNGKLIGSKHLYVAIAKRKEVRKEVRPVQSLYTNPHPIAMPPPVSVGMPMYPRCAVLPPVSPRMHMYPPFGPVIPPRFVYQHQQLLPGMRPWRPFHPNALIPMVQGGHQSGGRVHQQTPIRRNAPLPPPLNNSQQPLNSPSEEGASQ